MAAQNEEDIPIGGDRFPIYARFLHEFDEIVQGDSRARATRILDWWNRIRREMHRGNDFVESVHSLMSDHRICGFPAGLPCYDTAEILIQLSDAFIVDGRREEAERVLDEAERSLREHSRYSVKKRVDAALEAFHEAAKASSVPRVGKLYTKDGRLRDEPRALLKALPASKLRVLAEKAGYEHDSSRKWSPLLQKGRMMGKTKDGWVRLPAGDAALLE